MKKLPAGRSPEWALKDDYTYSIGPFDTRTLPKGSFIKPVHLQYVPKHILETQPGINPRIETFCYTRFGFVLIPNKMIRSG